MTVRVDLEKPVTHGNETLAFIELREPTVADIKKCGMPFTMITGRETSEMKFDMVAVCGFISRLGSIPPSVVERLCIADLMRLQAEIVTFFG